MKRKYYFLENFKTSIFIDVVLLIGYIVCIYFYFTNLSEVARRTIVVAVTVNTFFLILAILSNVRIFCTSLILDTDKIVIKKNKAIYRSLIEQYKLSIEYKNIKSISTIVDRADSHGREFKIGFPWKKIKPSNYIFHCQKRLYLVLKDIKGKSYRIYIQLYSGKDEYGLIEEIACRIKRTTKSKEIDTNLKKIKNEIKKQLKEVDLETI